MRDCPGRRRSNSNWISSSEIGTRGGHPSITTPTAPPCDSPQVVIRNSVPKELDMHGVYSWGIVVIPTGAEERDCRSRLFAGKLPQCQVPRITATPFPRDDKVKA